jgi:hypothetical protein
LETGLFEISVSGRRALNPKRTRVAKRTSRKVQRRFKIQLFELAVVNFKFR